MRWFAFTKRNFLETLREPLSWVFMIGLPVLLFIILEVMMKAIGGDMSQTPQFEVEAMTVSMIVFSYSFICLFTSINLSKDREERFLLRLKSTPMTAVDFVLGYTLSSFPFILLQEVLVILTGICLGLKLTWGIVGVFFAMLPVAFIFIGLGILFGSCISSKGVGGVASVIPTACSLLGGTFFPLSLMSGAFKIVCYAFPFANAIDIGKALIGVNVYNLPLSIGVCLGYIVAIYATAVAIFTVKLHKDSI